MLLEQLRGFGGGKAFALNAQALLHKQPIDGGWGYLSQRLLDPRRKDSESLLIRLDPVLQDGLEAFGAGVVGSLPDTREHSEDLSFGVA